jgi:hypothetical protein
VLVAIGTDTLVAGNYYIIFNAMSHNKGDGWVYYLSIIVGFALISIQLRWTGSRWLE